MRRYEGALTISLRREDGIPWPDENDGFEDLPGGFKVFLLPIICKIQLFSVSDNSSLQSKKTLASVDNLEAKAET